MIFHHLVYKDAVHIAGIIRMHACKGKSLFLQFSAFVDLRAIFFVFIISFNLRYYRGVLPDVSSSYELKTKNV